MLTRFGERVDVVGKMNLLQRAPTITDTHVRRQERFDFIFIEVLERVIDEAAKYALRQTFSRRIHRRDSIEVDRAFFVRLDDLELRMLHAHPLSAQSRLTEN